MKKSALVQSIAFFILIFNALGDNKIDYARSDYSNLIPSFLMPRILEIAGDSDIQYVANSYISGYLSEIAQKITNADIYNHKVRNDKWFVKGGSDVEKLTRRECLEIIKIFGFRKIKIKIKLNSKYKNSQLFTSDKFKNETLFLYCPKKYINYLNSESVKDELDLTVYMSTKLNMFFPGGSNEHCDRILILYDDKY